MTPGRVALLAGAGGAVALAAYLYADQRRRAQVVAQRQAGLAHQLWSLLPFQTVGGLAGGAGGTVGGSIIGLPILGAVGGALGRLGGGAVDNAWGSYFNGDDL